MPSAAFGRRPSLLGWVAGAVFQVSVGGGAVTSSKGRNLRRHTIRSTFRIPRPAKLVSVSSNN